MKREVLVSSVARGHPAFHAERLFLPRPGVKVFLPALLECCNVFQLDEQVLFFSPVNVLPAVVNFP